MKKLKDEKGAITVLVLVSILFMVSFLISSYAIVANKAKAQKEMVEQTRAIYDNTENIEETYNSYFMTGEIIPIYTVEQLFAMGKGESIIINGKYYIFSNNDSTVYMLMNDLAFNAYDYGENYYWTPMGERGEEWLAGFIGNNHKIEVKYKDIENDEYSVIYSQEDDFAEPEYKVKVSPRVLSESGDILTEATIYTSSNHAEFVAQEGKGEMEISVKRLVTTKIYAGCEGYRNSGTETITIKNPNKIPEINLVLGNYSFTINATPEDAKVTINGVERTTISVNKGEQINWKIEAIGYVTKEGTHIVEDDIVMDISLEVARHTLTINATPTDAIITIDGIQRNSITVDYGTEVTYQVECDGHYTKQDDIQVTSDIEINVDLELWRYISFSEQFYFTRCSDETYNGLLNGGEATVLEYNLTGGDYSMGSFYLDEADIISKIPTTATISKVTVYFDYYHERDNTTLYKNRIKTTIYTGETEKMATEETEYAKKEVKQVKYELTNISREDLSNSLIVNLVNYIKGTLELNSTVKNLHCVIEGEYPDI